MPMLAQGNLFKTGDNGIGDFMPKKRTKMRYVFRPSSLVGGEEAKCSLPYRGLLTVGEERSVVAEVLIDGRSHGPEHGHQD